MLKSKTYLTNSNSSLVELRLYVKPFTCAEFESIFTTVQAELQRLSLSPTKEQVGLYSNRAGLHFYCITKFNPVLAALLNLHRWRKAQPIKQKL